MGQLLYNDHIFTISGVMFLVYNRHRFMPMEYVALHLRKKEDLTSCTRIGD